jgi:uncharacterized membrane protein YdbT with pleckstrin-like domain
MPYPQRLLNPNEEVALDLHPHWWYFAESVALLVVSGVAWLYFVGNDNEAWWDTGGLWITGVVALYSLGWTVVRVLKWKTTNFVVTNDRLIARSGVIAKKGIEIPLERVNNVSFNQSIFERLLGAGDLLIESGGEDGQQRFSDIRKPNEVQNIIHMQMEDNQRRSMTFNAAPATDVATQLEKLEGLRDRGAISPEEFEAQKRRLLG